MSMRQRDKKGKYYMVLVGAVGVLFGASIGILFFPETQAAASSMRQPKKIWSS